MNFWNLLTEYVNESNNEIDEGVLNKMTFQDFVEDFWIFVKIMEKDEEKYNSKRFTTQEEIDCMYN